MQDLSKMDRDLAFRVKVQIALAWNAQRMIDLYPNKREKFQEYIEERKKSIREMLNVEHDEIWENGKKIFDF